MTVLTFGVKIKVTTMLLHFILLCTVWYNLTHGFMINSRTCSGIEDTTTYELYQLDCHYRGPGLYKFQGHKTVKKLTFDRLTEEAHIRIHSESLEMLHILSGNSTLCSYITAPTSVKVIIGEDICVHVCIFTVYFLYIYF